MSNYKNKLKHITTFIFDYDGVLTNGIVLITQGGEQLRTANVKDGYALQLAVKKGFRIAIISGGKSESMRHRFDGLGITDVFLGIENKKLHYENFLKDNKLQNSEILFMGDDIPDFEIMQLAGVPTCPADAAEEIKQHAVYISSFKGGEGCVRDIIEQTLKVQHKWFDEDAFHW
jgi:3-deoxy-D-manno-octulosonate 8-phosphate phosphatase (KDO 8-P phosphatase)